MGTEAGVRRFRRLHRLRIQTESLATDEQKEYELENEGREEKGLDKLDALSKAELERATISTNP